MKRSSIVLSAALFGSIALMVGCAGSSGDETESVQVLDEGIGTEAVVGAAGTTGQAGPATGPVGPVEPAEDKGSSGTTGWGCIASTKCVSGRWKVTTCDTVNRQTIVNYGSFCLSDTYTAMRSIGP